MNSAPAVYVPTDPEGDGLTLPTLLSLLAHGIVIGILIYSYQHTELDTTGSIETTMVSPEQLAEMQGQILANRAAASDGSQMDGSSSGALSNEPFNSNNSNVAGANSSQSTSRRVPVFTQSDNDTNANSDYSTDAPILMSQEQQQRLSEQSQEYESGLAEWAAEQDDLTLEKLDRIEQNKKSSANEENERLKELRGKQNTPPKVEKPNSSQRNIEITAGSSGGGGKNYSLSDGQSTLSGDSSTSSPSKGSGRSASSGSSGASNSQIVSLIKRNYNPPTAAKGSTQRATLTITVNASGNVVSVSASGADSAVNEAAKQAVLNTRNLPIDTDDPKYPTFTIQFNGSN
ncbi:energy transducer TonB [Psychrobacter frigidicola]|uniref:Energy transducer TonB n=1 Tax=Psychrobacter frigidicola TaxID=45611 RepID=A0A5C7A3T1_9GAMM|nr:cell envelope integrity protein TolA [Psychrobacter frigidicola]TXD97738.1 energy transducer TonB [Psychrobacter frigidicola]